MRFEAFTGQSRGFEQPIRSLLAITAPYRDSLFTGLPITDYFAATPLARQTTTCLLLSLIMPPSFSFFDFCCWLVVFLMSMSAHEAAHAFTAKCLGDPTAYLGGQVTLDPIPHIRREPIGMLVLPVVSYLSSGWMIGWASAPYNPAWAAQYPRRAAVMAFAGPAANFAISLICWLGLKLGLSAGFFIPGDTGLFSETVISVQPGLPHLAAVLLSLGFSLNLLLGVFNLIPLPPLDGSALPLLFLGPGATLAYQRMRGGLSLFGLIVAWQIFPRIYRPIWFWMESTLR
jgi:Zn-dependent protease